MIIKRVLEKLKRQDWVGFLIEIVIVILGIFIAYQLTVASEQRAENNQLKTLIQNMKLENEKNLEELEELKPYRESTVKWTKLFFQFLDTQQQPESDSIQFYITKLFQISTPDLQQQNLIAYINSTHSSKKSLELKNVALRLKAYYDEWVEGSIEFRKLKHDNFFDYLADAVDFKTGKIVNDQKIRSLFFKNKILEILFSEMEQHRLYEEAYEQSEELQSLMEELLKQ